MAKSEKKASGGKKAKKQKLKMPKTIAGVKVPKEVRKAADPIIGAATNPLVAEIAAAALVAAAGALTVRRRKAEIADTVDAARAKVTATGEALRTSFATLANDMADRALSALEGLERNLAEMKGAAEAPATPERPGRPRRPDAPATH